MNKHYFINGKNREEIYDYIHDNYEVIDYVRNKEYMLKSSFPFILDLEDNTFIYKRFWWSTKKAFFIHKYKFFCNVFL